MKKKNFLLMIKKKKKEKNKWKAQKKNKKWKNQKSLLHIVKIQKKKKYIFSFRFQKPYFHHSLSFIPSIHPSLFNCNLTK